MSKIWPADDTPSEKWPLYTRGNVGEVFPEVVLPLTWDSYGHEAEMGWRDAYERFGIVAPDDFGDEEMIILGVFGGYCYINASYVRMVGVRAPGGSVEQIDSQFFGESDAPAYVPRKGDKNLKATLRLGKKVFQLLGMTEPLPELEDDKRRVQAWIDSMPDLSTASETELFELPEKFKPLFRDLFSRHIEVTFAVALTSGLLSDLCIKAGKADQLVSILGGIGEVESAAPSSAMWALARSAQEAPSLRGVFDTGIDGVLTSIDNLANGGDAAAAGWKAAFADFIAEFGSRGPNEWDAGADPWELRPELALAAIDRMRYADASHAPAAQSERLATERALAVEDVRGALNPVDRWQFDKALRSTQILSQCRERSKTTVIRAVHTVRLSGRELGRRVAERGGPADGVDLALLNSEELAACMENPAEWLDTIEDRKALRAELSKKIPPFIFEGEIPPIETWESTDAEVAASGAGDTLQGIAGCPGVARGTARVVLDPAEPGDLGPGDVLIAPITDPSWTPLFLAAEAVVVDVGATMSHAVIVSRELGIPCVVSAVGATRSIPDGATIEVDGNSGTVTVIELP